MKPARFEYEAPEDVDELLELLREHGSEAKLLAGGQSLGPLLNLRLATPSLLIDLNRVAGLSFGRLSEEGDLVIGAMWRHRDVERSPLVRERWPVLAEAETWVAHPSVRNRGTIGGTLSHGDSTAEIPTCVLALGGEMVVRGPSGTRIVPAEQFFAGFLSVDLHEDEYLAEVRIPAASAFPGQAWAEFAPRHGDYAIVGVAACVDLGPDQEVETLALALAGVADTPVAVPRAVVDSYRGAATDQVGWVDELALSVSTLWNPSNDLIASGTYKRALMRKLVADAVNAACFRARAASQAFVS